MAAAKKKDEPSKPETVKLVHRDAPDGYVREVRPEEVTMWRTQGWVEKNEDPETTPAPSNPEPKSTTTSAN